MEEPTLAYGLQCFGDNFNTFRFTVFGRVYPRQAPAGYTPAQVLERLCTELIERGLMEERMASYGLVPGWCAGRSGHDAVNEDKDPFSAVFARVGRGWTFDERNDFYDHVPVAYQGGGGWLYFVFADVDRYVETWLVVWEEKQAAKPRARAGSARTPRGRVPSRSTPSA